MPPSQTAINLVCTRCTGTDHASLLRWYNDHAQLLMASQELQSAELFRLTQTTAKMDYFCLYHFAKLADFSVFDSGEVMGRVRDVSNAAAGRSSIEIVKRTQYERLLHRRWSQEQGGQASAVQASLLALESGNLAEAMRWLNDALYALHQKHPLQSAQVYASSIQGHAELFVLLQSAQAHALPPDWHDGESPYAPRPQVQQIWQAQAERIAQWLR